MANPRRCDVCMLESMVFLFFLIFISFRSLLIDHFNNIFLTVLFHFQAVYFYCSQFSSNLQLIRSRSIRLKLSIVAVFIGK